MTGLRDGLVVYAGRLRADPWSRDLGPAWLRIRNGRFEEIARGHTRPTDWPDCPTVDLGAAVVLPGLVDSHVHLTESGDGTGEDVSAARSTSERVDLAIRNARTALRAGITTVADCGGSPEAVFEVRARAASLPDCARTLVAAAPITTVRGHTWRFGGEARDDEAMRDLVRRFAAAGADFIKIMASGGGTPGAPAWEPSFSEESLRGVVETAASLGRPLKVHCLSADSMRTAVAAGARLIEHGKFRTAMEDGSGFDPAVVDLIVGAGAVVCPTLSVGHHVLAAPPEVSGDAGTLWGRRQPHDLDDFRRMVESGVRMVSGTDAGWRFTPFDALPGELRLMAGSGMTNRETLASATTGAADALGVGDRIGRIAAGYQADFIAVDADPVDDLSALDRPQAVARDGHVIR
ncbi:imidazolonepropionase-like amidohydrolase [Streptosporangium album]|uniref:Imidazolonepropionase-like amidohydrolase n=1 Tax=Streptosporangium album TaxID=47479 RepID=A0A7W7RT35_9ACTN|nr:amidohydrolase family protein [Streptosporangium album]MBB4937671.1 imidazolonepropionase-like amidohydrolase [Streptosporangium album]